MFALLVRRRLFPIGSLIRAIHSIPFNIFSHSFSFEIGFYCLRSVRSFVTKINISVSHLAERSVPQPPLLHGHRLYSHSRSLLSCLLVVRNPVPLPAWHFHVKSIQYIVWAITYTHSDIHHHPFAASAHSRAMFVQMGAGWASKQTSNSFIYGTAEWIHEMNTPLLRPV